MDARQEQQIASGAKLGESAIERLDLACRISPALLGIVDPERDHHAVPFVRTKADLCQISFRFGRKEDRQRIAEDHILQGPVK